MSARPESRERILLVVAPNAVLAHRAVQESGFDPTRLNLRMATRPAQLRGWSAGTPVLAFDTPSSWGLFGIESHLLGQCLLAQMAVGRFRVARETDFAAARCLA